MSDLTIGFNGLGNMGGGMAMNIIRSGYKTIVHDLNKESATEILEYGASWADNPKEIAVQSDVIFTSLPGPVEVEAVAIGPEGIIEGTLPRSGGLNCCVPRERKKYRWSDSNRHVQRTTDFESVASTNSATSARSLSSIQ